MAIPYSCFWKKFLHNSAGSVSIFFHLVRRRPMRAVIVDPAVAVVDRQPASVQLPPVRQDAPFVTIVVVQASAEDTAAQSTPATTETIMDFVCKRNSPS